MTNIDRAIVTGSRAYGTPREDSDIDLVVLVSREDAELLYENVEFGEGARSDNADDATLRFGKLNLLCVTHWRDYEVWREGTEELKRRKPVTRAEAVAVFERLRAVARAEKEEEAALALGIPMGEP